MADERHGRKKQDLIVLDVAFRSNELDGTWNDLSVAIPLLCLYL